MVRRDRAAKKRFLAWLTLIAAATVVLVWPRHSPAWASRGDQDAIYISVFRRMMARRQRPYTGLAITGGNLDTTVLNQFRKDKGVEADSRIDLKQGAFADTDTGGAAEVFILDQKSIRWYGPTCVSIEAFAHGSPMDGSLGTYYLLREDGRWIVRGYRDSGVQF